MKVKVLKDYFDMQLMENKKKDDVFEVDEKRAKQLIDAKVTEMYKIKEVIKAIDKATISKDEIGKATSNYVKNKKKENKKK